MTKKKGVRCETRPFYYNSTYTEYEVKQEEDIT